MDSTDLTFARRVTEQNRGAHGFFLGGGVRVLPQETRREVWLTTLKRSGLPGANGLAVPVEDVDALIEALRAAKAALVDPG